MENKQVARNLFILVNKMKRLLDKYHQQNGLYLGQARILTYLYRNLENKTYQKDLENAFQIRGGTVTGLIDSLEKIELINRIESKTDKRKKIIVLTNEGKRKAVEALDMINKFENLLYESMTEEEFILFSNVIMKLNNTIDEEEKHEEII